jgi:D-glycero-D-manno-heptose 1,7-bisphosphate phosphatase
MSNLTQAVILCGGQGTRLRPLTDNLPKPMVLANGKPFLESLLEQLSEQGIKRFLLLTGYRSEKIVEYFGDGAKFGWEISYSNGPTAWDTGKRLWEARNLIDEQFLLLYSDNFAQFKLRHLKTLHYKARTAITLLLAPKNKGNIKISEDGRVIDYDKNRVGEGFDYVEIGYMIVEKAQVFIEFPFCQNFPNFSFSLVLQKLAKKQNISGLIIRDPYHSISDPERLTITNQYLKSKKILLIDRDGTINKKAEQGQYILSWNEFQFIPETKKAMKKLSLHGYKFIVITNQAGISRGMLTEENLNEIHQKMIEELSREGVEILKIYMCPDHWDSRSDRRKPSPGMFFEASSDFSLRLDQCLYVGDDERDCMAAFNANCGMVYLGNDQLLNHENLANPFIKSNSLLDCCDKIIDVYGRWGRQV